MSREVKIPGPEHPITITPSGDHVVVRSGETVIADSRATLVLQEASYPPVRYIPRADLDASLLAASDTSTYCPFKGDAGYETAAGVQDALWFYAEPYPAVAEIADHVAFYTDRVELTVSDA
jgi:uncharacterized protein (DUF427 family)